MVYEDEFIGEEELDAYNGALVMLNNDEMTLAEAGFMAGYGEA